MKNIEYDQEELEILDFMENGNPQSVPNLDEVKEQLRISAHAFLNKRKKISLELLENDLEKIKIEANKNGIPYQTLISSIIHNYTTSHSY